MNVKLYAFVLSVLAGTSFMGAFFTFSDGRDGLALFHVFALVMTCLAAWMKFTELEDGSGW